MPSTPKADNAEILTPLSDDPHVNFYPLEMNVQDAAITLPRTLHPLGLLSSILTDHQWEDYYPGNTTTDAQGQAHIAPRYTPPAYTELDPQMNSVQLYIAKESNDRLQLWIDASDVLEIACCHQKPRRSCT
jgi:hypothetical protein